MVFVSTIPEWPFFWFLDGVGVLSLSVFHLLSSWLPRVVPISANASTVLLRTYRFCFCNAWIRAFTAPTVLFLSCCNCRSTTNSSILISCIRSGTASLAPSPIGPNAIAALAFSSESRPWQSRYCYLDYFECPILPNDSVVERRISSSWCPNFLLVFQPVLDFPVHLPPIQTTQATKSS